MRPFNLNHWVQVLVDVHSRQLGKPDGKPPWDSHSNTYTNILTLLKQANIYEWKGNNNRWREKEKSFILSLLYCWLISGVDMVCQENHSAKTSWVIPYAHFFLTLMDAEEMSVFMCRKVKGRTKEYERKFISATFTLLCLQGQPDTCQCNEASGVWEHTGVVVILYTLV